MIEFMNWYVLSFLSFSSLLIWFCYCLWFAVVFLVCSAPAPPSPSGLLLIVFCCTFYISPAIWLLLFCFCDDEFILFYCILLFSHCVSLPLLSLCFFISSRNKKACSSKNEAWDCRWCKDWGWMVALAAWLSPQRTKDWWKRDGNFQTALPPHSHHVGGVYEIGVSPEPHEDIVVVYVGKARPKTSLRKVCAFPLHQCERSAYLWLFLLCALFISWYVYFREFGRTIFFLAVAYKRNYRFSWKMIFIFISTGLSAVCLRSCRLEFACSFVVLLLCF